MSTEHTWTTWGKQHAAEVSQILTPRSVAELQRIIADAHERKSRIKVIGYSRSSSAIAQPSGTLVRLDFLTGITRVNREAHTATFLAGTSVRDANKALMHYGLAFENLGRLDEQSLAGAVATGTHGTGIGYGIMATQVAALRMVTANDELLHCSADENPEIFRAALVGLGSLGIIVELTFNVVPLFRLHAAERGHNYTKIVPAFEERSRGADHYEFSWFPGASDVRTRRLTRLPLMPDGYEPRYAQLSRARRHGGDLLLNNGVYEGMLMLGAKAPSTQKALNVIANWGKGNRRYADLAPQVFTVHRRVRQNNMEYAFDITQIPEVLDELRGKLGDLRGELAYPLVVRSSAGDNLPLSPANGRTTGYISVREYWRAPYLEEFTFIENVFKDYGGRPHWGQLHTQDAASLAELYPEFNAFVALRDHLDPQGIFLNDYLEKVLLGQ